MGAGNNRVAQKLLGTRDNMLIEQSSTQLQAT